jgi:hypothetical protein
MRTTISIDDNTATIAEAVMAKENRNFSNLCEVALQQYCDRANAHPMEELMAAAKEAGLPKALAAVQNIVRKKKRAA